MARKLFFPVGGAFSAFNVTTDHISMPATEMHTARWFVSWTASRLKSQATRTTLPIMPNGMAKRRPKKTRKVCDICECNSLKLNQPELDENAEKDEEQSSEAHGPRQALDIANQKGLPNVEDLTRGISKEAPPEEKIAAASRRVAEVWAKAGPRQTGSIVPDDDPLKEHSQDSMADIHGKREREINKEPHGKRQKVDNEVVGSQGIGGETSIGAARTDSGLRKRQLRVSIPEKNSAPPSAGLQPPARKRDIAMNEGNLDGSNTGQPAGRDVLTSSTGSTTRLPPFEPFPSGRLDLSDFSGNGLTPSLSMNPFAFSGRGAMGFPFSGIFSASSMAPPQWPDSGRRDSHTHGQMQGNGRRSGAHNSMQVQEGLPGQLFPHGPDSARAKEVVRGP